MTSAYAGEIVLTEPQRAYLADYVRDLGDRLGLRDWRLTVSDRIAHNDSLASSFIRDRADEAEIAVGRTFVERHPDDQRVTLVHELLHPHFHRVTQIAMELIEHELGTRTEAVIEHAIDFQEELAIERLARALAPTFPPVRVPATTPAIDTTGGSQLQHA